MAESAEHILKDQHEQLQTIDLAVNPVIVRAREGVETFQHSYEAGNEAWKSLLTDTHVGQELQAMYLGLKPALSLDYIDPIGRTLLQRNIVERFGIRGDMIYNRDLIHKVITANINVFPDYSPDQQSLDDYMEQVDCSQPSLDMMLKMGILLGYPKGAVTRFVRYYHEAYAFKYFVQDRQDVTVQEKALINGYVDGYPTPHRLPIHEDRANINKFRDDHEAELQAVIEKIFPDAAKDVKRYILTERYTLLPGFSYNVGNPTQEDYAFAEQVRTVFEASGMNAYVAALRLQKE